MVCLYWIRIAIVVQRQWFRKLVEVFSLSRLIHLAIDLAPVDRWKFQSFQDSFLGLSWWKPLSYWVQTLYKSAISRKEPRILKPSSNSGLALASITGPATDPSHQMVQEFLYLNSRYGNRATFFRAKFLKFNDTCSRCACTILLIRRYKQWYHKKSILKNDTSES